MKILNLLAAVLLAGCGSIPPATQIIEVPVHTPCVKEVPPPPMYEFDKLPLNASNGAKILALARDWLRGRAYEGKLSAIVVGCL